MHQKDKKQFWKRGLGIGLSFVLTMSSFMPVRAAEPEYPSSVPGLSEELKRIPEATKAGSIPVSDGEDMTLYGEPFAPFTAGSESFRIPTLISLRNRNYNGEYLFASADARWEEWNDGGGIDSIAAVSGDGGATWHHSFPIYFPDSYGYASSAATTVIDTCAIEGPDGTIYFIADVNPTGSTTMYGTVGQGTGYVTVNGKRYLALTQEYGKVKTKPTDDNLTDYPYYVEDFDEAGHARILNRSDSTPTGYGVDEWYNIYEIENGEYKENLKQPQVNRPDVEVTQNCFYKDSKFHVYHIDYIWVVQSKDGGMTWEHPRDITDQIKREDEYAILVSPGKGIVTKDGEIAIGLYSAQNGEHASMIYSKDGETWKRTNDITDGSSEDEIVQLEDGTLRMFYRGGGDVIRYADITKGADGDYVVGDYVSTDVRVKSSINVSAVLYSKKINGKQAILVSRSGGGGGLTSDNRLNGKIFTFLVDDTKEGNPMQLYHTFDVPGGKEGFVYSCMTELKDGRIAMLWEPNHSTLYFDVYDFENFIEGVVSVELQKDDTPYAVICKDEPQGSDRGDESVIKIEKTVKEGAFLRDHISNNKSSLSSFADTLNESIDPGKAEFTFRQTDTANGWKIYSEEAKLYLENQDANDMFSSEERTMTVTQESESDGAKTFRLKNGSRPVFFYEQNMDFNSQGSSAGDAEKLVLLEKKESVSEEDLLPGYARVSELKDGGRYLITYMWNDGSLIVLYPVNGSTADHTKLAVGNPELVTVTGVGEGTTTAVIGGTSYKITVTDASAPISFTLEKGETYFQETEALDTVLDGGEVLGIQKIDRVKEGLFDHTLDAAFSLESYAGTAHEGISLKDAEFTFESSGSDWTVSHGDVYLSNPERAEAFFSDTAAKIRVTAGNENTFRLGRAEALKTTNPSVNVTEDKGSRLPIGNLVFYYREMNFRSYGTSQKAGTTHGANPYGQHASYDLTLLEAQDGVSADDVIPGYRAADSITSGKKYLISYVWNGNIFVLYPENGIGNSTKLVNRQEKGFLITAKSMGSADLTIDGKNYHFTVTDNEVEHEANALQKLLEDAKSDYQAGGAKLTTFAEFKRAYESAVSGAHSTDAQELRRLFTDLNSAWEKLKKEKKQLEEDGKKQQVTAGHTETIQAVSYKVTNTKNKTVSVSGGAAATLKIQAKIKIQNETYTVTAIDAKAFSGSPVIKKVIVSDTITDIGDQAFAGCKNITSVTIGKNVKTIGKKAFYNCKKLKSVTVKNKAKLNKVGSKAFQKTAKKISIKLPKNLKKNKKLKNQLKKAGIKKFK